MHQIPLGHGAGSAHVRLARSGSSSSARLIISRSSLSSGASGGGSGGSGRKTRGHAGGPDQPEGGDRLILAGKLPLLALGVAMTAAWSMPLEASAAARSASQPSYTDSRWQGQGRGPADVDPLKPSAPSELSGPFGAPLDAVEEDGGSVPIPTTPTLPWAEDVARLKRLQRELFAGMAEARRRLDDLEAADEGDESDVIIPSEGAGRCISDLIWARIGD